MLTARQQEVLAFIRKFTAAHGYSPTVRELGVGLDISSPNGVMSNLNAMERKGAIKHDRYKARSIVIIGDESAVDRERLRCLELVQRHIAFTEDQQPRHTWHDLQDLLEAIRNGGRSIPKTGEGDAVEAERVLPDRGPQPVDGVP